MRREGGGVKGGRWKVTGREMGWRERDAGVGGRRLVGRWGGERDG